jgi:hypothetical protein
MSNPTEVAFWRYAILRWDWPQVVDGKLRFWAKYKREVIAIRIRDVLKPKELCLPRGARSVAANRTRTTIDPVQAPSRIAPRRERLASEDIFVTADPDDEITGDLPPALDSPTSLAPLSTPHTRDIDFIKRQMARLPRQTEL